MRNYASVNLKKNPTDLDCDPICNTSFFYSFSSQCSGNPGVQPPGREEPREAGFVPSGTLTPSRGRHREHRAVTHVLLPGACICSAAAGRKHSLPALLCHSLPPNTQATSTASSTHWLRCRDKKRPK